MWPIDSSERESRRQAETACHPCRRRKVKCNRGYPQCSGCEQTEQVCNYPPGPLKPGPKIGSLQRRRKRPREHPDQQEKQDAASAQSPSQENSETTEAQAAHPTTRSPSHPTTRSPSSRCSCDKGSSSATRERPSPLAATTTAQTEWSTSRDSRLNIHDLSFILHPSHETPTPERGPATASGSGISDHEPDLIARVCAVLGVDQSTLRKAVKVYFDNMVAISLFHEPSFREKINGIVPASHIHCLMAAVLAYAARFYPTEASVGADHAFGEAAESRHQAGYLLNLAFSNIDEALKECDDEAPPLCVLQALIIATHCQLTQGVRTKAWRSLGTCIRLAYELNLHLVDADYSGKDPENVDVHQWREDEEKRRTWWAIWEMDVFASTIRRTPPAVDWSQMETLLPVEDQDWFQNRPRASCFMERDPVYRWKALQECGNQSPKAWFLVVNSLMKEAQVISTPRSIPYRTPPGEGQQTRPAVKHRPRQARDPVDEATKKLELLANSVHCFTLALPAHLQYRNQYFGFDARAPGQMLSLRQLHCGIYNIYVMTQLARLMIYRYDVFGGRCPNARRTLDPLSNPTARTNSTPRSSPASNAYDAENLALARYFEATDNILTIVSRSNEDHIRHINPFLSSTIWLASAVQLLRMEFSRDDISRALIKSKFEVLYMTYKRCVSFWDVHTALQQNLEALEAQLEGPEISVRSIQDRRSNTTARPTSHHARADSQARFEAASLQVNNDQMHTGAGITHETNIMHDANCEYSISDSSLQLPHPTAALQTPPPSVSDTSVPQTQARISQPPLPSASQRVSHAPTPMQNSPSEIQTMPMFNSMHQPPLVDRQQPLTGDYNTNNYDPLFLMSHTPQPPRGFPSAADGVDGGTDFGHDWRDIDLPSDIRDLLSGFSTY